MLTAEQYQQHQEQLVLMQKQLEQSQFQANNPTTTIKTTIPTTTTTNNTPTTTQVRMDDEATPELAVKTDTSLKETGFILFVLCPGACVQDVGPGQRTVCCFSPRHHRSAAGLQVQRGPGRHQWTERGPDRCRSVGFIRPLITSRAVIIRSSFKCHRCKQLLMFN